MMRKVKLLGVALAAVTALNVSAASLTHAAEFDFGASPGVVTGLNEAGQQHILQIPNPPGASFNAMCGEASLEGGTFGKFASDITVTPTYSSCKLAGTFAIWQMNGCKYTLTGSGHFARTFTVDIVGCTSGKQIQIKTALCTVDIPEQNGLSHLVGTNLPGALEITLEATVTGITSVQTGAACPGGNNKHSTSGSFSGNTIVGSFIDEKQGIQLGIEKHGHEYFEEIPGSPALTTVT